MTSVNFSLCQFVAVSKTCRIQSKNLNLLINIQALNGGAPIELVLTRPLNLSHTAARVLRKSRTLYAFMYVRIVF